MKKETITQDIGEKLLLSFKGTETTKPKDLFFLTKEYVELHAPKIIESVAQNINKDIIQPCIRIDGEGNITRKEIKGTVKEVWPKMFVLETNEDMSYKYEEPILLTIRVDNAYGVVPLLTNDFNPYQEGASKRTKGFFAYLTEVKEILQKCIASNGESIPNTTVLEFYHGNGIFSKVMCEIIEVNNSNVKILHWSTDMFNSTNLEIQPKNICSAKYFKYCLFVTPEKYLSGVNITLGTKP